MRAYIVNRAGGPLEMVERDVPEPGDHEVLVKVDACGICHSDDNVRRGFMPGQVFPRTLGHEVAGHIVAVGSRLQGWKTGDRVGLGWHGGHCFHCSYCRRGDYLNCVNQAVTGSSFDGGYAEYLVARPEGLARIPDDVGPVVAAPLMCAGLTTFNALRNSGARPGDLVAVQGIGGLGHMALQYAARMGFRAVAVSNSSDKQEEARKLGAVYFVDSSSSDPGEELQRLGGAEVILATAPNTESIQNLFGGLTRSGSLLVVAVALDAMQVVPAALLTGRKITGSTVGTPADAEDTLRYTALTGVTPITEVYPFASAAEAYERMESGKARFRVVLEM